MTHQIIHIILAQNVEGFWLAQQTGHTPVASSIESTPAAALLSLVQQLGLERSGAKVLTEAEVEAVLERGRRKADWLSQEAIVRQALFGTKKG